MARWVRIQNFGNLNAYFNVDSDSGIVIQPAEKEDSTWVIEVYSAFGATDHFGLAGFFPSEDAAADAIRALLGGIDVTPTV